MKINKLNTTYWSYSFSTKGRKEEYENGKLKFNSEIYDIKSQYDVNEIGYYSSLEAAIDGFLSDELHNENAELVIDSFDEEKNTFKLKTEGYLRDFSVAPSNTVIKRWKKGELGEMTHVFYEVIFIKHTIIQATFDDFSIISKKFPNIIFSK